MSAGRRSEALDAYRDWYGLTTSELGLEPSRELRDLQRSLLEDEPSPPRGRHSRSVLLAASSPTGLRRILGLASALGGGETGHELILLLTTDPAERGVAADQALHAAGAELSEIADGLLARSAAIVSSETIVGALRIARHQDVDLVLVDGHGVYPGALPVRAMQRGCARELAVRRRSHPDGSGARALRRGGRRMVGTRDRSLAGAGKRRASADFRRSARG